MRDVWWWWIGFTSTGLVLMLWEIWRNVIKPIHARAVWKWTREPGPFQDEIGPALQHCDFASKRLAMHAYNGDDVMAAIAYARGQLDLAEREILRVDPEKRPANDEQIEL